MLSCLLLSLACLFQVFEQKEQKGDGTRRQDQHQVDQRYKRQALLFDYNIRKFTLDCFVCSQTHAWARGTTYVRRGDLPTPQIGDSTRDPSLSLDCCISWFVLNFVVSLFLFGFLCFTLSTTQSLEFRVTVLVLIFEIFNFFLEILNQRCLFFYNHADQCNLLLNSCVVPPCGACFQLSTHFNSYRLRSGFLLNHCQCVLPSYVLFLGLFACILPG